MELETLLIELSNTPGISGFEAPIRARLEAEWRDLADTLHTDALGSLIATRHGDGPDPRPRVMIAAHMDEIGLIVTRVEGAFLRFRNVGGVDRRVLLSQPVVVHGKEDLPGLIGSRPPHVLSTDARKSYPEYDDLVIDTGLPAQRLAALVQVGTPVSFAPNATGFGDGLVTGKALDNRASLAAATLLLRKLRRCHHAWDVQIAATVQEEVGLKGAETAAWRERPDLAVALDTTWATGVGVNDDKGFKLGGGLSLGIGPNAHPGLYDLLVQIADDLEMKLHPEPMERSSGTDGWAIQVSREGVPVAIVSIPIRNMHMPVEIVALKDIRRAAHLLAAFVCGLDDQTMRRLALG